MLILSRHIDERIMIGEDIVITIVDIRGDRVRIGIGAPQEITVHREEVWKRIKREGGTEIRRHRPGVEQDGLPGSDSP